MKLKLTPRSDSSKLSHLFSRAFRITLILPLLLLVSGCSDDEPTTSPCGSDGVDRNIVGDWIACNDTWEYGTIGSRIAADGSTTMLGIDWSNGTVALLDKVSYTSFVTPCTPHGVIIWKQLEHADDTLIYRLSEDRLELMRSEVRTETRLRRVNVGQKITDAADVSFVATINGSSFSANMVSPQYPAMVRKGTCLGTITDLEIYCRQDTSFAIIVHDFTGPESYPLGNLGATSGGASLTTFSGGGIGIIGYVSRTDETHIGSVVITSFDETTGRCTGTFEFVAVRAGGTEVQVVTDGIFDLPIRQTLN